MEIILASASPRRLEILTMAGYSCRVQPTDADETVEEGMSPAECVALLSARKAEAAAVKTDGVIVAADTVVALDGKILGKPRDKQHAREMLRALSGRRHTVYTGVTVRQGDKAVTEVSETAVEMRRISEEELLDYVASGEPLDKAGAYGIQGRGGMLVSRIEGDYYTVMGLPLCMTSQILKNSFGVEPCFGHGADCN